MKKKTAKAPVVKPIAPTAPTKAASPKKPRAKAVMDSRLKTTILSAPHSLRLDTAKSAVADRAKLANEAASSFMRTTAFTVKNKVRTAMTGMNKAEKPRKIPKAPMGMSFQTSMQPTSSQAWLAQPFNRFKLVFMLMVIVGVAGSFAYSNRLLDAYKDAASSVGNVFSEKTWAQGMLTQTNGVPDDNDKPGTLMPPRMMEETVVPVMADEANPGTNLDTLLVEEPAVASAPKIVEKTPVAKLQPKAVKAKVAKKSKSKTKTVKGKAKSKAKVANK